MSADAFAPTPTQRPSLGEALRVWARIGLLSFGGPAGQIALMHRELVEQRRWIGEARFLHALNYCMLLPGPEAQQLATYIGWLMHRTAGGLIAGTLFVVPGALVMLALSWLYVNFRELHLVGAAFLGVKAAVLAVVVQSLLRIGKRALVGRRSVVIAAMAFLAIFLLRVPFPLIILAAAVAGWLGHRGPRAAPRPDPADAATDEPVIDRMFARGELGHAVPSWGQSGKVLAVWLPLWLGPVAALWLLLGPDSVWTQIGIFFSSMAVVTFGGAYAVLAYVAQAAVDTFGWMTPGEMIDGLGLAETTPGPLILVVQFVGFLATLRQPGGLDPMLAASLGALLTTWVTFAPCFLWILLGAPYIEQLRSNVSLAAALSAVTAAVVGVILNLAVWFAMHVIFREVPPPAGIGPAWPVLSSVDWRASALAAGAMIAMLHFRAGMVATLVACAGVGVALGWLQT